MKKPAWDSHYKKKKQEWEKLKLYIKKIHKFPDLNLGLRFEKSNITT